jgi:magnesium-protoporphyrin IX monomethyl ester (oxidative) cyclase
MREADPAFVATCAQALGFSEAELLALREEAARFTADVADAIVASRPRIVGCTSTFQQQAASIALLRAVRERDPEIITMIGGTNCESAMGLATRRNFPWIDYVVSGEADELIVPFVRSLLAGRSDAVLPHGVIDGTRAGRTDAEPPRASVWSLDAIPTPDYDDFFQALERSPLRDAIVPAVVVETSRGCWWGAKSHCTFCGLNGGNMSYRAKSPDRAVDEFHRLAARYGVRRFTVVDNIMDMQYHQAVLPRLAGHGYDIFYETKANLRRHHMQSFADAGVRSIQPGMESLHDQALRLLAKGNTAWMNVQVLKWAGELGMALSWIFLIDVPEQRDEWYLEMLGWLPLLTHLTPPVYASPIQFVRFSPYHREAARYGFELVPEPAYAQVYPLPAEELNDLANYFTDRSETRPQGGFGQQLLVAWLGVWRDLHQSGTRPVLEMRATGDDALEIIDTRSCRTAERHRLEGAAARIYRRCDEATARSQFSPGEQDTIARLLADKLLVDLDGRLLALAVDVSRPRPADVPDPSGHIVWELVDGLTPAV